MQSIAKGKYKYITYLIGAMEITAEGDCGGTKREKIAEELFARNVFAIDPTSMESIRTGMSTKELSDKLVGWMASGHWEEFDKYMNTIWRGKTIIEDIDGRPNITLYPGDIHYVEVSDWITALYNRGDKPCGTFFEAGYAYKLNKPIYLITDCAKKELPKNFIGWVDNSGGAIFPNKTQYFNFIDGKYELKRVDAINGK